LRLVPNAAIAPLIVSAFVPRKVMSEFKVIGLAAFGSVAVVQSIEPTL